MSASHNIMYFSAQNAIVLAKICVNSSPITKKQSYTSIAFLDRCVTVVREAGTPTLSSKNIKWKELP